MHFDERRRKSRIVIVEDEPALLAMWGRIFRELGCADFWLFSDPFQARIFLQRQKCDILISDVNMPGLNGYELARMTLVKNPDAAVVLTTAYTIDLARFNLKDCRFHLLHKPYSDIEAVKNFIVQVISGHLEFEESSEDSFSENDAYPQVTEWKL